MNRLGLSAAEPPPKQWVAGRTAGPRSGRPSSIRRISSVTRLSLTAAPSSPASGSGSVGTDTVSVSASGPRR
ncbi:hypothetical protein [Streptomyces sp. NPDC020362]|uniref:hypothetical protein n=1 Tax=Streptomyces sp. NPDC020362 TaxID=3154486 RepID=UPI003401DD9E